MLHYLIAVDSTLGRLEYNSLSQQALMEMVVSQLSEADQNRFKDDAGNFLDIEHWDGVVMKSDNAHVHEIIWNLLFEEDENKENYGSICVEWLPDTVEVVRIDNHGIGGVLMCFKLPINLRTLDAQNNRLTGELNLPGLPGGMEYFCVAEILLSETADFLTPHKPSNLFSSSTTRYLEPFRLCIHLRTCERSISEKTTWRAPLIFLEPHHFS